MILPYRYEEPSRPGLRPGDARWPLRDLGHGGAAVAWAATCRKATRTRSTAPHADARSLLPWRGWNAVQLGPYELTSMAGSSRSPGLAVGWGRVVAERLAGLGRALPGPTRTRSARRGRRRARAARRALGRAGGRSARRGGDARPGARRWSSASAGSTGCCIWSAAGAGESRCTRRRSTTGTSSTTCWSALSSTPPAPSTTRCAAERARPLRPRLRQAGAGAHQHQCRLRRRQGRGRGLDPRPRRRLRAQRRPPRTSSSSTRSSRRACGRRAPARISPPSPRPSTSPRRSPSSARTRRRR